LAAILNCKFFKISELADAPPFVHMCESVSREGETLVSQVLMPAHLQQLLACKLVANIGTVDARDPQLASVALDKHKYSNTPCYSNPRCSVVHVHPTSMMVPSGGPVSIWPLTVFEQLAVGDEVTFNCVESSETLRPAADGPTVTIWHCANHSVRVA